jgi:hypothetical protein
VIFQDGHENPREVFHGARFATAKAPFNKSGLLKIPAQALSDLAVLLVFVRDGKSSFVPPISNCVKNAKFAQ